MEFNLIEINNKDLFDTYTQSYYRYEFTVTYNPKFIYSKEYAETMTHYVIKDVYDMAKRNSKVKRKQEYNPFFFNYVVEYMKNGYPHIHGTLFTYLHLMPQTLANWESKFYRKYGKTEIWATGLEDRIHKNDHFNGTWQQYLCKEGIPRYYQWHPHVEDKTKTEEVYFQ